MSLKRKCTPKFLQIPLDVVADFILKFLNQTEISRMLIIIKGLNKNVATWKSYFLNYSPYFVTLPPPTNDYLRETRRLQTIRRNWKINKYQTRTWKLQPYLIGGCAMRIDPFTECTATMTRERQEFKQCVTIYSADLEHVRQFSFYSKDFSDLDNVQKFSFDYRNGLVLTYEQAHCMRVWRTGSTPIQEWPDDGLSDCKFSNDASSVFSTHLGTLHQTSVATGQVQFCQPYSKFDISLTSLVRSFQNDTVLTVLGDHFKIWDVRQKYPTMEFVPPQQIGTSPFVVGDNAVYHYAKREKEIYLFDTRIRKHICIKHCANGMHEMLWTPDSLIMSCYAESKHMFYSHSPLKSAYINSEYRYLRDCDVSANKIAYLSDNYREGIIQLTYCDFR